MRKRIAVTFFSLIALTLVCLAVPLATLTARSVTQGLQLDRQADTEHFAQLAGTILPSGRPADIGADLDRYETLYHIRTVLLSRNGTVVASSSPGPETPAMSRLATSALFGESATSAEVVWPWDDAPFIVAVPVFSGGECVGAVLTISPTDEVRAEIIRRWAVMVGGGLVALLLAGLLVEPVIRWILRPVHILRRAATAIAAGKFTARADPYAGPPELRSLTKAFNTMGDTIQSLIARQQAFASHASHQLRTPLAVLRLQLEELTLDHPAVAKEVATSVDEVNRLANVCEGLLAFARVESESIVMGEEDVSVVADDRVSAWQTIARREGVCLVRTGEDGVVAETNPGMLAQVLDALIDNAIKFNRPGGKVTVRISVDDAWVEARVVDDGPGMSPEARLKATEPFWRGADTQNITGSGLGLTICVALVMRIGGQFELLDAQPHGLAAVVRLHKAVPAGVPGDQVTAGGFGVP